LTYSRNARKRQIGHAARKELASAMSGLLRHDELLASSAQPSQNRHAGESA
jgi:hypothetical protein